jgi:hypothetical protein
MWPTSPVKCSSALAKSRENVPIPHLRGGYVLTIRILYGIASQPCLRRGLALGGHFISYLPKTDYNPLQKRARKYLKYCILQRRLYEKAAEPENLLIFERLKEQCSFEIVIPAKPVLSAVERVEGAGIQIYTPVAYVLVELIHFRFCYRLLDGVSS